MRARRRPIVAAIAAAFVLMIGLVFIPNANATDQVPTGPPTTSMTVTRDCAAPTVLHGSGTVTNYFGGPVIVHVEGLPGGGFYEQTVAVSNGNFSFTLTVPELTNAAITDAYYRLDAIGGDFTFIAYSSYDVAACEAPTTKSISAKALTDHECDSTEWHFVINQLGSDSDAPSSIHVTWANGNEADVPLDKVTGGVAHYSTTANLDSTVTSATANIISTWGGQFNLSHGPCSTTPTTETPPTTTPPTTTPPTTTPPTTETPTTQVPPTTNTTVPPTTTTVEISEPVTQAPTPVEITPGFTG